MSLMRFYFETRKLSQFLLRQKNNKKIMKRINNNQKIFKKWKEKWEKKSEKQRGSVLLPTIFTDKTFSLIFRSNHKTDKTTPVLSEKN